MEEQPQTVSGKFKDFVKECRRVLLVTKKPTMMEYKNVVIVTGLGIILIGFIGFLISLAVQLIW